MTSTYKRTVSTRGHQRGLGVGGWLIPSGELTHKTSLVPVYKTDDSVLAKASLAAAGCRPDPACEVPGLGVPRGKVS